MTYDPQGLIDLLKCAATWEDEESNPRFPEDSDIPEILKREAVKLEEYIQELHEEIASLKSKGAKR